MCFGGPFPIPPEPYGFDAPQRTKWEPPPPLPWHSRHPHWTAAIIAATLWAAAMLTRWLLA